jgi:TRAP-type C4-dicarboxylate transport system permease large subunit
MKIACLFHSLVNEIQECAALTGADPRIASMMRRIRPFYGVMFVVLMPVTYIPDLSLSLPRLVLR